MKQFADSIIGFLAAYWQVLVGFLCAGGLWTAYGFWRDRIRVTVALLGEPLDVRGGMEKIKVAPVFEIENLGARPTSLRREVQFSGYAGSDRKGMRETLTISNAKQRTLQPSIPTEVTAENLEVDGTYVFTWYRTYTFQPTRGFSARVRIRNASMERLGFFRFYFELARFRCTRWVPDK